jgi:hypothetical protein
MLEKIVSGGQTGADRAALDWAISRGVPHGGWCPKGRKAEDGRIPDCYDLRETSTANYLQRTEQNVVDSDGTVIFTMKPELSGGSKRTAEFAAKHGKPLLHLSPATPSARAVLRAFIETGRIKVLNVAGPRASNEPDIASLVKQNLDAAVEAVGGP